MLRAAFCSHIAEYLCRVGVDETVGGVWVCWGVGVLGVGWGLGCGGVVLAIPDSKDHPF